VCESLEAFYVNSTTGLLADKREGVSWRQIVSAVEERSVKEVTAGLVAI
jgi:hypothetical protein